MPPSTWQSHHDHCHVPPPPLVPLHAHHGAPSQHTHLKVIFQEGRESIASPPNPCPSGVPLLDGRLWPSTRATAGRRCVRPRSTSSSSRAAPAAEAGSCGCGCTAACPASHCQQLLKLGRQPRCSVRCLRRCRNRSCFWAGPGPGGTLLLLLMEGLGEGNGVGCVQGCAAAGHGGLLPVMRIQQRGRPGACRAGDSAGTGLRGGRCEGGGLRSLCRACHQVAARTHQGRPARTRAMQAG